MYNIKGPSKIVAKTTRRGMAQNIENYKDHGKNRLEGEDKNACRNVPKLVFQKKVMSNCKQDSVISPQQIELIKFIHESWISVYSELEQSTGNSDCKVCYYQEDSCDQLQDFKPFDFESWWGKRLYAQYTAVTDNLVD